MYKFTALKTNTYSYFTENKHKYKKSKDTKRCAIKRILKFEDYKHFLEETQLNKPNKPTRRK